MLALALLIRNWRSGELKLLSVSIVLAVAVLSGISIFTDRLESTLLSQSNSLLGADNILTSSQPVNQQWKNFATAQAIKQTHTIEFGSMVYAGDEMHLAGIKAVENNYPLRGSLVISQMLFAINAEDIQPAQGIPARGEVWVDSRVLPQLKINVGDELTVGELPLRVTQILIREPESGGPFSSVAPRVLMNIDDVPATKVIQAGSNVTYSWLLASDNVSALEGFIAWLKPQLSKHEKLVDIASSQERLGSTLTSGKSFLLFAGVIAVLLSGIAIAIAARQFSDRHTNQVALMKSLGASSVKIRMLYFTQLLFMAVLAAAIGLVIGYSIQILVAKNVEVNYHLVLQVAHLFPYGISFLSGLICLVCFAMPALWFLPTVSPLKILRRELAVNGLALWLQVSTAFFAIIFLVLLFSADLKLTAIISGILLLVIVLGLLFSLFFLFSIKKLSLRVQGFWRLALSSLQRRRGQSLLQITVFAIAIMLLLTLTIIRTSLIEDWKNQLPMNAPNHFLVNIAPSEVDDVNAMLTAQKVLDSPLYPMARGRLIQINGAEPTDALIKNANALQREVNLTQSDLLAVDNQILEGYWWNEWKKKDLVGVSVERDTAKNLQLKLGDKLTFSLGGLNLMAEVASIRSVDWKTMHPNFFFIFEPGAMNNYSPTYMTSIYLPPTQKIFINQLLRKYPTILVMELDRIIDQMRSIINQVSNGIGLVLWLTLIAGSLVLFAAVMSSIDSRKQEAGLLRALGSSRQIILGSVFAEFIVVGLLSGLIAIIGAEVLLLSLQKFIFHSSLQPHYRYWFLSPIGSAFFIGTLGVVCCRSVVTTPPMVVLREAA